jgi:tetratricopeptide (TPR) repeat protein
LEVTETTPIQAQVKLAYYTGDQPTSFERNLPFKLYSRNTIRWDKKERFAAFVTPNDPPVIDFARGVAVPFGDAHKGAPLPNAMVSAWSVFSGLGAYGISYVPRPNNPYDRVSLDSSTVDTLQFARETLARKSGDCADVVALLASALESLTVTTCALDAPGHLFLMFDTGETQKEDLGFPDNMVVSYAGSYWIPIEATMLGSPFLEAWKQGATEYQRWSAQGKLHPIDIHLAWRTYEPVTLPDVASGSKAPSREAIEEKFLPDWKALADLKWQTSLAKAKAAAAANPTSGEPWMRLGFLAFEFHRHEEAKEYFMKARSDPKTAAAAANNLGNLAFIRGDMESALANYTQAMEKDPNDPQIYLNLARLYLKQGKADKASASYEKAVHLDPSLREQYPDVSSLTP